MPDWLNTLLGRRVAASDPAARLAASLRRYPPFSAPHPGRGSTLSDAQAQANFSHFQSALPQRLHCVTELLRAEAQIDPKAALSDPPQHAPALTDSLQRWASSAWPALPPQPRPSESHWLNSHRDGEDIVFSLLLDLAILLGEVIRCGNPAWHWGVDLDPQNIADDMPGARRVVLLADPVGTASHAFVLDVEQVVVHRFLHADDAGQRLLNPFRRLVDEALRGDAMAHWRGASG